MDEADLPGPHLTLSNGIGGRDLEKFSDIVKWSFIVLFNYFRHSRVIRRQLKTPGKHAFLVHGDTITTVIGAVMGRLLHGKTVMHVEAGLRSFNWRHPFPEELDRIVVSKIARYHFSPGPIPISNLHRAKVKGKIIDTKLNTVLDSLRYAQVAPGANDLGSGFDPESPYYIISIHRNELMSDERALKRLLESIQSHSEKHDIQAVFLDHPITKERLTKLGYDHLLKSSKILRIPKLSYYRFIQLVAKSKYIVTDSGGLQEEAAYLDIPCLVHRMATERQEGVGENVVLSMYDQEKVDAFLENPGKYQGKKANDEIKPTKIIIDTLAADGFI